MSGDAAITTITKTTVATTTTTTTTTRTTTTNTDDFYANATSKCCCCFTFLLLLLSSGVWGPARPLLLQQNNKCGSATRAVACPCPCLCVCEGTRTGFAFSLLPLSLSLLCSSSAVRFSLVWLVYCGRLAGGVGQAGDTMEPLSRCLPLSLSCTQIMAFAKLDPGSFSGFLLLLLLLLSASLVWARDHVDYNYIRKVAIQIRWNSIRRISWLAPFESERSSQLI